MTVVFLYRAPKVEVLPYALKGVEKYVQFNDIYLIGDMPDWWRHKAIRTIPKDCIFEDVYRKYQLIAKEIEDDILLMADDIFLTKPYKPIHYYNGKLKDRPMQGERAKVFQNTLSVYPEINNFNTHRPIPVRKEVFKRTISLFDKPFSHDAFCFGYPTKQAEDCKIHDIEKGKDMPIFSTYNENEHTIEVLSKLYK